VQLLSQRLKNSIKNINDRSVSLKGLFFSRIIGINCSLANPTNSAPLASPGIGRKWRNLLLEISGDLMNRQTMAPIILAGLVMVTAPSSAQVAPSSAEVSGYTGPHAAAHKGDLANLSQLIAAKADLNSRDSNGRTPLHVATFARQREVIRILSAAGAQLELLDLDRYDAITIASVADDDESLRVLLGLGASAKLVTSRYDGTALIAAAHLGHDSVVRQLIAAGAPLDHVNNLHWTAVIESIVLGNGGARHQATLRALIDAKANLQLSDRMGNTPLALARARGYKEMIAMLEKAGAR
jgi:uncharacterized protein